MQPQILDIGYFSCHIKSPSTDEVGKKRSTRKNLSSASVINHKTILTQARKNFDIAMNILPEIRLANDTNLVNLPLLLNQQTCNLQKNGL